MHEIKRIIEALLFVNSEPLSLADMRKVVNSVQPCSLKQLKDLIEEMKEEYEKQDRAFQIHEVGEGFQFRTLEHYGPFIEKLGVSKKAERLSHASSEVLAIVAYRQPITRAQIEAIRGIDPTNTLALLMEKQLIQVVGKLEAPGRPLLYGVTTHFLTHYGLKDIKDIQRKDEGGGKG